MNAPTKSPIHVLHSHTVWSVLDGASTVDEYIKYVNDHGLGCCANTEHGLTIGTYDLITKCQKAKVKPIPGMEGYLAPREDYIFKGKPYDYGHITLWAMNQKGYSNLMDLSSRSWMAGRVTNRWGLAKPRVTWEDLDMYREGIICGSGCIEGPICKPLLRGETQEAYKNAALLKAIYGDRLFLEVLPHFVDRNYTKDEIITVENTHGVKFCFAVTDTVLTPEGRMTVKEAMDKRIPEIWDPEPKRFQDGKIVPPGYSDRKVKDVSYHIEDFEEVPKNKRSVGAPIIEEEDNEHMV